MSKTTLTRFEDWEDRLRTFLDNCSEREFEWGQHDCTLFAASAVQRITGVDFAEGFRGTYSDAISAAEVLRDKGAGTLKRTVSKYLGASRHIVFAKRGDVVVNKEGSLGICVGRFSLFVGQLDEFGQHYSPEDITKPFVGLIPHPTADCARCWPVAHG